MKRVCGRLWLAIIAVACSLLGCGQSVTAPTERAASPPVVGAPSSAAASWASPQASVNASTAIALTTPGGDQHNTVDDAWLIAARENPDPAVRLHALNSWAQRPGESLDPVTYALVDPDESIRVRAQELLEQNLKHLEQPRK